ncbi:unnamed protein product [Calypogeia fissa]
MTPNIGDKRGKEGDPTALPVSKKARGVLTPNIGSEDVASLRRKNEVLRRWVQPAREILNQFRRLIEQSESHLSEPKIEDEEAPTLSRAKQSLPDSANGTDVQLMLEAKLGSCQLQLNDRDLQIGRLENDAMEAEQVRLELEVRVVKMQQQLCKELEGSTGSYADGAATPFLLESTLKALQTTAASFTRVFSEYGKTHINHDVTCALTEHFQNAFLTRTGHMTYLLRAWAFEVLFQDFENESFTRGGTSIFLDPTERRLKSFEHFQLLETNTPVLATGSMDLFEKFLGQKWRDFWSLWPFSAPTTVDAELEIPGSCEAKHKVMESFRSLAKGVWSLHKLSHSFQTRVDVFRVRQNTDLNSEYMDSVVSLQDDERFVPKVGFMICPGFRLKNSVFKCQIYLAAEAT